MRKSIIIKTCVQCGKEFKPHSHTPDQQYCGRSCYNEARPKKQDYTCAQCGEPFQAYANMEQKYCSKSCGLTARNLTDANPSHHRDISGDKNPMYGNGHLISGERNGMSGRKRELSATWKGGRKQRKDGYVSVIAPDDHPNPSEFVNGTKYVLEHRLVMERHLGRYLLPTEVVHHKDKNPRNNAIDNLELFENQSAHMRLGHGKKKRNGTDQ